MGNWNLPLQGGGHMEKPSKIYYQTMTKKDVEERLKVNDILLIPFGSTENHGDAQPYGEDGFIVTRMCELIAQKTGCTVAAPLWYASHPFAHLGQSGNVPIPDDLTSAMVRSIVSGYWNAGFRKQILMSSHGQEYIIPSAIQEWAKKYQVPAVIIFLDVMKIMGDALKDKAHGGPFETPFRHGDEAECSICLALFPEFVQMENCVDNKTWGFLPEGHIDKGGDIYNYPIPGQSHVGGGGVEFALYPEGVLGKPSLAKAEKAFAAIENYLNYVVKLHDDILAKFPPGVLPEAKYMTQRSEEEIDLLLKGPDKGGRHLYTVAWPS
jgi:creatinine amidohydrolase/Fe(II)-dependent formamide hydrolase-like protein